MASNDPGWGGNGGKKDGPPDLDEVMRDLTRKINAMFGKRGKAPNQAPQPAEPMGGGAIGLVAGIIFLVWMATGVYIVDQGSVGVVMRFGQYAETTDTGPHWHLPYPIETATVVTLQQVRELEIGYRGLEGGGGKAKVLEESLMLTADENIIDIQFAVQYDLKDAEDYLFNNRSPDGSVKAAAESAIREMVGKSNLDAVLQKDRENVAKATKKLMQDILDRYKSGINILSVSIQNVYPPDQVKDAFDDVNRANQDMQREVNKGQAYANEVIPKARGQAARLLEEANGYKQRVISEAQGNASRFSQILTQYEKAPEVTRSRLYLEAQEHVLSNTSKVLIDQKAGNGNILYLPLDKLISSQPSTNQPSVLPETQASPSPQSSVADESLIRSRDAFRNRERENRP